MMSRTGDAVQMLGGLAITLAGVGVGVNWAGAGLIVLGMAIGAHGAMRAYVRGRTTHDL